MLVFLPAVTAGFVADDFLMLKSARAATDVVWPFTHTDLGQSPGAGHFYRPLWVVFNDAILGVFGDKPAAFHVANLLLFAVIAVEVFLLVRRLAGDAVSPVLASAAFALYPRHGESVAWVTGNTDLLAAAPALAALLCLLAPWPERRRLIAAMPLAASAALAKEVAFVLPALAFLVLLATGPPDDRSSRGRLWAGPLAIFLAQLPVFVVRLVVVGGIGGDAVDSVTPRRVVGSAASFAIGSLTPPQLDPLRAPLLAVIPLLVLALAGWSAWRLYRRDQHRRLRLAAVGLAWFAASLLPVLNQPLNLSTGNGGRLLLIPSVGLALTFAALIDVRRARLTWALLGVLAAGAAASCLVNARDWVIAGRIADRVIESAIELGPANGSLVVLSLSEDYRQAHVFLPGALDAAVAEAGRPDLRVSPCVPMHVRSASRAQASFRPLGNGSFEGRTTRSVPFRFPVLGGIRPLSATCSYGRAAGDSGGRGTATRAIAHLSPERGPQVTAFFDGYDLRPCCAGR